MNSLNKEIEGKVVVLKLQNYHRGGCTEDPKTRAFICTGGFGCSPDTNGSAVIGNFLLDGESARVYGGHIQRLATKEESKEWLKEAKKKGLLEGKQ